MSFDQAAASFAERVRNTGRGFLTIRRDELREAFGVGRLTENQSASVCEALGRNGVFIFPNPFSAGHVLRLYEQKHPVAGIAEAVTKPDVIPESALRSMADVFARERAGKELRSDDVPWISAFDVFLQVVIGRDPEGWEELRDDRHPTELAREIAVALGFSRELPTSPSVIRLAAAVCGFRPRTRRWLAAELTPPQDGDAVVLPLLDSLAAANRRLREEHEKLLQLAARLLLKSETIPTVPVELGMVGLRYRRELEI